MKVVIVGAIEHSFLATVGFFVPNVHSLVTRLLLHDSDCGL
jgi:hypothetical protein